MNCKTLTNGLEKVEEYYRIAEWNIDRKTKKTKKFYYQLMQDNNIDMFFLTEVSENHKNVIEPELKEQRDLVYKIRKISPKEYIIVLIKKERFDQIDFLDEKIETRISSIDVKLKTKQEREFIIRGVRLHTQCTPVEFKEQMCSFIKAIEERKIDIVIGDYNWNSTIGACIDKILGYAKEWKINKEVSKNILHKLLLGKNIELPKKDMENELKLCKLINSICNEENYNYELQPQTKCGYYSAKTVNHHNIIYSNPDRVLWNKAKIKVKEEGIKYIPQLSNEKKEFPENWPSDHSILLFEFAILNYVHI